MTPQQNIIINLLQDRMKHCPTVELFMKDDRTRISELRKMGYVFNEGAGICRDPKHRHGSKVKLRQLVSEPGQHIPLGANTAVKLKISEHTQAFLKEFPVISKEEKVGTLW